MDESIAVERTDTRNAPFIDALARVVGRENVTTDLAEREFYSLDFSEEGGVTAMAVVKPSSAEQVAELVRLAGDAGVAVNTRGGGMSYTKGHVPVRTETIILDANGL